MRSFPPILIAVALVTTACVDDASSRASRPTTPISTDADERRSGTQDDLDADGPSGGGRLIRSLTPFDDCRALLDHIHDVARDRVGPYGLDDGSGRWFGADGVDVLEGIDDVEPTALDEVDAAEASGDADAGAAPEPTEGRSDDSFTTTNNQEAGVDEPDVIKTDGRRIVTISDNILTLVDAASDDPTVTGRLDLPLGGNNELFLSGDRAIVVTNRDGWGTPIPVEPGPAWTDDVAGVDAEEQFAPRSDEATISPVTISPVTISPEYAGPTTTILEIDLSEPHALRISATLEVEGRYLSGRAVGDAVRIALSSGPSPLPWLYPQGPAGEERATEANRDVIGETTLGDWMPNFSLITDAGATSGPVLDCDRLHRPAEFSGLDVVSVLDLDLGDGLAEGFGRSDAVGILASGQTIYSSTDRFYVATTKWAGADLLADDARFREWSDDFRTDLHAFEIADDEPTRYAASGSVAGTLLNQFSLDEHEGYLRVITTDGSPWEQFNESETSLVVLAERDDELVSVGRVGGLGRGESLYSARLMDEIGFAVTFRQIDPFYVLDLRDPSDPRVAGELKIPGFSTYLHPVGDDRVLGIGQSATENGATTGLKLSLFDVSDPTDPREVSVWTLPGATSPVESNHRAFQMIGSIAIVPVESWADGFHGAVVFDVGDEITEVGRVSHDADDGSENPDCRRIRPDELPEETELFSIASEPSMVLELCDGPAGESRFDEPGRRVCDVIPVADAIGWFGDEVLARRTFEALGADDDDRLQICYPDGGVYETIERSIVIGETLWTMSRDTLQAHRLGSYETFAVLSLR